MVELNEKISYIKATESPLSADVVFIKSDDAVWIFDVGTSQEAASEIAKINCKKNIVLSHFHPDHIANILRVKYDSLFVGDNTAKYVTGGTVVKEKISFDDVELYPIVSCHAKGSLILKTGEYAFLGDATYATYKKGKRCYNAQQLHDEINFLKSLDVKYFGLSHDRFFIREKKTVIALLENIYSARTGNEPYINA